MSLLDLSVIAIIIGTTIWVWIDARTIGVRKGVIPGFFNMGVAAWVICCLGIWIIAFPGYLAKRGEYKRRLAAGPANVASGLPVKFCPECGADARGAKFCPQCGTGLQGRAAAGSQ